MPCPNQKKSYIYALLAVLLWSTVASAFKISLTYLSPLQLLFFATFFSWLALSIIVYCQRKYHLLLTLNKKTLFMMLFLGLINPCAYYYILFKAYDLLPAQEAQAINYTWALTLSYLSVFILKRPFSRKDFLAGIICYGGVFIIATKGAIFTLYFSSKEGVFYALLSTLLWAFYWIYTTKSSLMPIIKLWLNFSFGLFFMTLFMVLSEGFIGVSLNGILSSMYVGVFEMGVTFFLWSEALRYAQNTSKIANLIFLSPFLSLFFISYFVGEKILLSTFVGLVCIIIGIIFQQSKIEF